jgi:hypothetical protein
MSYLRVFGIQILFVLSMGGAASAATIESNSGELYQGSEYLNEHPTGRICYVYLDYVVANPVGKHCYSLTTRPVFATDRDQHPKDEIELRSRITNQHRPEYPGLKTCATSLDGKTSGNDIYSDQTEGIYTQFFAWAGVHDGDQYDFFLTFSPESKRPVRARLHRMNWLSEKNYDCVGMQKL